MTDIYGANLYSRYLAQQQAMMSPSKVVAQGLGSPVKTGDELSSSAAECRSILVGLKGSRSTSPSSLTAVTRAVVHGT